MVSLVLYKLKKGFLVAGLQESLCFIFDTGSLMFEVFFREIIGLE